MLHPLTLNNWVHIYTAVKQRFMFSNIIYNTSSATTYFSINIVYNLAYSKLLQQQNEHFSKYFLDRRYPVIP